MSTSWRPPQRAACGATTGTARPRPRSSTARSRSPTTGPPSGSACSRTSSAWTGPSSWSTYQAAREQGKYVTFNAACGYDLLQSYVRSEHLLGFMATDPGFVKEMVDVTSDLILASLAMMLREGFRFDGLWVYNDMGYRNTSLFSPAMYREMILPADRKRNALVPRARHADHPALLRVREGPDPVAHRRGLRLPAAPRGEGGHGPARAQADVRGRGSRSSAASTPC